MYRFLVSEAMWGWTEAEHYEHLAAHLERRGVALRRGKVGEWRVQVPIFGGLLRRSRTWQVEEACAMVVDERDGTYAVLDGGDRVAKNDPKLWPAVADPKCRLYLKAQYRASAYRRGPFRKIRPWVYLEQTPSLLQSRVDTYRAVERTRDGLYFRGKTDHSHRHQILERMAAAGVLSTDPASVSLDEYLEEMSAHRLALSLPGHGNLCHREIEAFAVGTPVLMPVLKNRLHDPLIPDHHYLAVDADLDRDGVDEVAKRLCRRYWEVIDDLPLLEQIRRQALDWYERNCRFPASLELTGRLLGLLPGRAA